MGTIQVPNTFSSDQTISSSEVNDNFTTIVNEFNGNIDANNIKDSSITLSKIASSAQLSIIGLVYPVGSYYINETDSTNPATLLGVGVWTAVTDKFIVGHGSTYTTTGGAATHTHTLSDNAWAQVAIVATTGSAVQERRITATSWNPTHATNNANGGGGSGSQTVGAGLGGATDAGSTIPPFQAAYIWRRTA